MFVSVFSFLICIYIYISYLFRFIASYCYYLLLLRRKAKKGFFCLDQDFQRGDKVYGHFVRVAEKGKS